jgi:hypothetical protein
VQLFKPAFQLDDGTVGPCIEPICTTGMGVSTIAPEITLPANIPLDNAEVMVMSVSKDA